MSTHRIICTNDDCYYNKNCQDCTFNGDIIIDGDDATCQNFLDYWNTPEYQNEYYQAHQNKTTGEAYRERHYFGAVTEFGGFTLYYKAKELSPETLVTEKRTGASAHYKDFTDPERLKYIKEKVAKFPSVCDLPDIEDILKERLKGDVK